MTPLERYFATLAKTQGYSPAYFQGFKRVKRHNALAALISYKSSRGGRADKEKPYSVEIDKKFDYLTAPQKMAVLRHEALHLRLSRHDNLFYGYAKKYRADTARVDYSGQRPKRYEIVADGKVFREFGSYEEMHRYMKISAANDRARYGFKKMYGYIHA